MRMRLFARQFKPQSRAQGIDRIKGEIGIDGLGAITGQTAEMMHLARFAGFNHKAGLRAQAGANEMVMDRRRCQQSRYRNALGADIAVGQNNDVFMAVGNGVLGLAA